MTSILLGIVKIWSSLFNCSYHKNKILFLNFSFYLWNFDQILNFFKKTMIVIANVFPKLQNVKYLVKPLSWNRFFRTSFDSQHVNGSQKLMKSAWEHFYHIFWSLSTEMTSKISPLLNFEVLDVFVNTLTDDENYPFGDSGDLHFPSQMEIS